MHLRSNDLLEDLKVIVRIKRRPSAEELDNQNTERPPVGAHVVPAHEAAQREQQVRVELHHKSIAAHSTYALQVAAGGDDECCLVDTIPKAVA